MMEDEQDEHNVACFRSSLSQSGNGNMTIRLNYLHIGVTADNLFWPQLYFPDVWLFYILVDHSKGVVISGDDISFASVGNILECRHEDVLIYNPICCYHETTEFKLCRKDVSSRQIFFS
jgi:hypothetical protein